MSESLTLEQVIKLYGKEVKANPEFRCQVCAVYDYLFNKGYRITAKIINEQVRLIGSTGTDEDIYPPDEIWIDIVPTHLRFIFK